MTLDRVFNDGYRRIQEKYFAEQAKFIETIAEARDMPAEWIQRVQGIFIPNNEFMFNMFGEEVLQYDCYRDGQCIWDNALIFPVRGVNECVAGIAGFFPFKYVEHKDGEYYYSYSSSSVFTKGRYLYMPNSSLMQAITDGYAIVVDGLFDAISLSSLGYNVASLMGSKVTPEIVMQLRFVKNVLVAADNDQAGMQLVADVRKQIHSAKLLEHAETKDVDELLKSNKAHEFVEKLNTYLKSLGITNHFGSLSDL